MLMAFLQKHSAVPCPKSVEEWAGFLQRKDRGAMGFQATYHTIPVSSTV